VKTMSGQEFCDRVVACVRHATPEEKADIRRELEGHMEDHAAVLMEAGYTGEEAEERATAAMGSPEEIGVALNRAYPLGWLVLSRVSLIITVLLCATLLFTWPLLGNVLSGLQARVAPQTSSFASRGQYALEQEVDIRAEVGDNILRIYKVGLDPSADGETGSVGLFYCNYGKNLFGYATHGLDLKYQTSAVTQRDGHFFGSGGGNSGAYYAVVEQLPVSRSDETLAVIYDRYGEYVRIEVPLPWEDAS